MDIGNPMHMDLLLTFEEVFPDEKPLTLKEYLKGTSNSRILKVASFFLGFKSYNSKYTDTKELLSMFFCEENNGFANQIYKRLQFMEKQGRHIRIINSYTSLTLFEYFFAKQDEPETQTSAEFERNIFKAYLILNTELIHSQKIAEESTKGLEESIRFPIWMFCMDYPIADTKNYDIFEIWITQTAKAIYFFEYLESNLRTQPLLMNFLARFHSPDWREYLKSLIALSIPAIKNENEAQTDITVPQGENFENSCAFLENLIAKPNELLDETDFLSLRAKPFYKIGEGIYRIIFNLFVVEKIFKGLYFLFRDSNELLPACQKIPNFRSFYCYEFSEKILLYKIINIIYPGKCVRFTGQELADLGIEGAPDYYLRKGKDILLFESKDFLINAQVKQSFDYSQYEKEFTKKLYYKENKGGQKKPGAVLQLIHFIRKLLKTEFSKDKEYHYKDISIYPVLITHDQQYDTPGFNQLINDWFQKELDNLEEDGLFIHKIKPLTVINIDSLIFYQVGLTENITLHKIIADYWNYLRLKPRSSFKNFEEYKQTYLNRLISFSIFLNRYFHKYGIYKSPPLIKIIGESLFKVG